MFTSYPCDMWFKGKPMGAHVQPQGTHYFAFFQGYVFIQGQRLLLYCLFLCVAVFVRALTLEDLCLPSTHVW